VKRNGDTSGAHAPIPLDARSAPTAGGLNPIVKILNSSPRLRRVKAATETEISLGPREVFYSAIKQREWLFAPFALLPAVVGHN
jgi:hypothetical protein